MDPPPAHPHSSSYASIPILAISLLGILTTAILLLSYYLFIINCCLHWRRSGRHAAEPARDVPLHNPHEGHGLDPAAIRSIPTLRFSSAGKQGARVECAVCLVEFEERELLRTLPGCSHSFHIDCIDTWLQSSANCPLCRFDVSRAPIRNFSSPELVVVVVTEVTDGYNAGGTEMEVRRTPTTQKVSKQTRKFWQVASMGDECIDISRGKDEGFTVQPIRRSFSMDSSSKDRSLFLFGAGDAAAEPGSSPRRLQRRGNQQRWWCQRWWG
ncbi:putative RING-H2 finger protein ATL1 [Iris pallida]|uniref:RING-type E3 ubiquitin transferase n=1 Tax=Iris pallida TaxID=29817 RepID=A0AAX6GG67_IRIPA|nr:putative RING-H2 finger protein ATL1 [Iris pallida]KAJ6843169.1 putative RING-H2 finger protein ATL1 [Iris pallida]